MYSFGNGQIDFYICNRIVNFYKNFPIFSDSDIVQNSRYFCPVFDFCTFLPYSEERRSRNLPTDRLFPRSRMLIFCPGYGSLNNKTVRRNHNTVQFNPLCLAICETLQLATIYETTTCDAGWEFSGGEYFMPHSATRGITILDPKYHPKVHPLNLGQFLVDITAPNALNLISENTMARYATCEMFLRLFSNICYEKRAPAKVFLSYYHMTGEQTPDVADVIASILEFIPDHSFQASQVLPKTDFSLRIQAKYFAWSLTMRCVHYRLKMRLTDTSGNLKIVELIKLIIHL